MIIQQGCVIFSLWETLELKAALPLLFFGEYKSSPDERKEGDTITVVILHLWFAINTRYLFKIPADFPLLNNMAICLFENFSFGGRWFQINFAIQCINCETISVGLAFWRFGSCIAVQSICNSLYRSLRWRYCFPRWDGARNFIRGRDIPNNPVRKFFYRMAQIFEGNDKRPGMWGQVFYDKFRRNVFPPPSIFYWKFPSIFHSDTFKFKNIFSHFMILLISFWWWQKSRQPQKPIQWSCQYSLRFRICCHSRCCRLRIAYWILL